MPEIVIEINGGANSEIADADTYTYKFRKNSRNFITLICQPQYCTIKYHRNSADLTFEEVFFSKNVDSSTPNVNPQLRDAMRKLNILHILLNQYFYIIQNHNQILQYLRNLMQLMIQKNLYSKVHYFYQL